MKKEELINVKLTNDYRGLVTEVIVKNSKTPQKSTKLGIYGITFSITHGITGNCQLAAVVGAHQLRHLSFAQFRELLQRITGTGILKDPDHHDRLIYKSSLLIDVREHFAKKVENRFLRAGCFVRLKNNYTNRTGSKMQLLIIDLQGKAHHDEA